MSSKQGYQIRDQHAHYFLTFQVVGWLDVFTRERYKKIVVDSLRYCQESKGLSIHAWVIMSNHMHCILSSKVGELSATIRDFKRHTSKLITNSILNETESRREWLLHQMKYYALKHKRNKTYQLWTHENHPIELHGDMFDQRLQYIHENPVRAGIVEQAEAYIYSSANNNYNNRGLLAIEYI
jgi:putative transposase